MKLGMANAARKRLEPLESLKYQRRMRFCRVLRRVCLGLFVTLLLMAVVRGATMHPQASLASTQTILVWSNNGILDAAFISGIPEATHGPQADRRSLATVVLLVDQPNKPPIWIERQLGGPLVYTSSFTLASLDPTPGFEPLSESDRARLAPLLESKFASTMPRGPDTIPPLNGTRTRLFLSRITGPIVGVLGALFAASLATLLGYGFVVSLLEGLRSGISLRACPACDYDLSATEPAPDPDSSAATVAAPDDGRRAYRQCPECGWKGRV